MFELLKCPKCKKQFDDPKKLREHRLKDHSFSVDYMNILQMGDKNV
jgi:uncharacterized C2H2 Zn-finger protein